MCFHKHTLLTLISSSFLLPLLTFSLLPCLSLSLPLSLPFSPYPSLSISQARSRAEAVVRAAAAAEQLQMMEIQMEDSAEGSSPIAGTGKVYARAEGGIIVMM